MSELNIIVADDSPPIRMVINKYLNDIGIKPSFAQDGKEAFAALISGEFNAALIDMQMPEMDGPEVVSKARSMGVDMPIIAMTTFDDSRLSPEELSRFFDGFLNKPILKPALLDIVEKIKKQIA